MEKAAGASRATATDVHLIPGRASAVRSDCRAHLLALQVRPLGDGEIGGGGVVIAGVKSVLFVAGAAGKRLVENFSQFVNLVPRNDAPFNRTIQPDSPLLLYRLPPICYDDICTPCRLIVALAPPLFEPATLYERGIRTNDCHDVLSRLNPRAVEYRHFGVGRANDNIGAARDLSRRIDRHEFGVHQLRQRAQNPLRLSALRLKTL